MISGLLFGVRALDIPTLAGGIALLLAAGLAAALVPAIRAMGLSPVTALRTE